MRRYVKYAKLQGTDAFLPVLGNIGSTLPPLNKNIPGLEMFIDSEFPNFLTVKTPTVEAMVPLTNIQVAEFKNVTKKEESYPGHPNVSGAV